MISPSSSWWASEQIQMVRVPAGHFQMGSPATTGHDNEHLAHELRRKKEMIRITTQLKELGLDSLDVVEVVMDLEEEYGVSVPDDVVQGWVTIADLVRWISEDRDADAA